MKFQKKSILFISIIILFISFNTFSSDVKPEDRDPKSIYFSINNIALKNLYNQKKDAKITKENLKEMMDLSFYGIQVLDNQELSLRVLNYIKINKINFKTPYYIGLANMLEGHKYTPSHNFEISNEYFTLALPHLLKIDNKELIAICYDYVATIESIKNNMKASGKYAKLSLNAFEELGNYENAIDLFFNQTIRFGKSNEWEKSKENAFKAIKYINLYNQKKQRLKYLYNKIALANIHLKKYDSVDFYLKKSLKYNANQKGKAIRRIYKNYALFYELTNKTDSALYYYKKTYDQFMTEITYTKNKTIEFQKNEFFLNKKMKEEEDKVQKKEKLIFIYVLSFLILSLVVLFILFRTTKKLKVNISKRKELMTILRKAVKKINENNLNLSEKNNEISTLLNLNQQSLFSKALRISTYNDSIKKLANNISLLIEKNEPVKPNNLFHIEKSLNTLIDEKEIWEDFKIQFENVRKGFFDKLKKDTPKLTVNDLKHCAYVLTKLSTKEVSNLINTSPRSVETSRYRIKKKIGLSKDESLFDYLNSL